MASMRREARELLVARRLLFVLFSSIVVFALGCSGGNSGTTSPPPTPPTAPAAPGGLTATGGNAQVSLTWSAVAGATSYTVYYATTTGVTTSSTSKATGLTATAYTATNLTNGTQYFFAVTASNTAGESAVSNQATATPAGPGTSLPLAPTTLTGTAGSAQVALSWTASATATTYNIYYGTSASLSPGTGTRISPVTGTASTVTGLVNGTTYYFLVTAVNSSGESAASSIASATPSGSGITVALVPGTAATATLQATATASLSFAFPATAVSTPATATIASVTQANLPAPVIRTADTFVAAFNLSVNPAITTFNVPVGIAGGVGSGLKANTTLVLARLQGSAWIDAATFLNGPNGTLTENLAALALPGVLSPGSYLLYIPAAGANNNVSNLGIVLFTDSINSVQVAHLYDSKGVLLATPTVSYISYSGTNFFDSLALTSDGSEGLTVGNFKKVGFFSALETGTPVASSSILNLSSYSSATGEAVALLPSGDEAVVSVGSYSELIVLSGILSGAPVPATTIAVPGKRDGLAISSDGKVLLTRGFDGLTVYSITPSAPTAGTLGGSVAHTYTPIANGAALGTDSNLTAGRSGMAISPADSARAVVIRQEPVGSTVQMLTGLTSATPQSSTAVLLPTGLHPYTVAVSPDGKLAVIGTDAGLLLYTGVDTGTLALVGSAYTPTYTFGTLGFVQTLGITLDGKYVAAVDTYNKALVLVPFTATGFAAPAAAASIAIPGNDQLIVH